METTVKQRLKAFIKEVGIKQKDFEESIGASNGYINSISKSIGVNYLAAIERKYPQLDRNWLLTGNGSMLAESTLNAFVEELPINSDYRLIPLINIDSVGGVYSSNLMTPDEQFIEKLIPFTGAKEGDRAIYQSGESMMPSIPPGSILQIRRVEDWQEYFGYGGTFVLWLRDDRRITKQVMRCKENSEEYVICHSHNAEYGDERLPKRLIREVWKVIKVLTDKGW